MEHIQQMIKGLLTDNQPCALATIINVQGSAYRKEGSSMIVKKDKSRMGIISGGCLENDLHYRAEKIFNTGKTEIHEYDLSAEDDFGWGLGAGCNGIITILVRDIDEPFREFLTMLNKYLTKKEPVLFIQSIHNLNHYMFISPSGKRFGSLYETLPVEFETIVSLSTPFRKYAKLKTVGEDTYFLQVLWPMPPLYIVGAGVDARPLVHLAADLGYGVHVVDWRESLCTEPHFPSAESLQVGNIVQLINSIQFSPLDSVVIMTHDFQRDVELLKILKECQLFYLGILGSRSRTERLIGGEIPNSLHSPVGLSIGADGPMEIAVSIVAELISKRPGNNK